MRLFLFLFILSTSSVFSADCTEADSPFPLPCDNLYINNPLDMSAEAGPIVINVTGVVEIKANIIFNGSNGANQTTNSVPGGAGGPSAGSGGGVDFLSAAEDGGDGIVANGKAAIADAPCTNGGGGGGLFTAGSPGLVCPTATTPVGAGGAAAPALEFDFGALFRGGYGGGAGGVNTGDVGTGGGGGGALHIIAGGNVTISSGVTISARGGNGGNALVDGGGGGAGSGGALWIQSTSGIISNSGTIDLRGGTGGRNNVTGAHGGDGGVGVFQFEDINGTTTGSGLISAGGSSSKLKSDITCGTIAKASDNQNLAMQMMMGFFLALMLGLIGKKRKS